MRALYRHEAVCCRACKQGGPKDHHTSASLQLDLNARPYLWVARYSRKVTSAYLAESWAANGSDP